MEEKFKELRKFSLRELYNIYEQNRESFELEEEMFIINLIQEKKKKQEQLFYEYKNASLQELWRFYSEILNLYKEKESTFIDELEVIYELILNIPLIERFDFLQNLEELYQQKAKEFYKAESDKATLKLNALTRILENLGTQKRYFKYQFVFG